MHLYTHAVFSQLSRLNQKYYIPDKIVRSQPLTRHRFDTFERTHVWVFTRSKLREYAGAGHLPLKASEGNAGLLPEEERNSRKLKLRKLMDQRRRQKELEARAHKHTDLPNGYQRYSSKVVDKDIEILSTRTRPYEDPSEGGWKSRHYQRNRVYEVEDDDTIGSSAVADTRRVVRRLVNNVRKSGARAKQTAKGRDAGGGVYSSRRR